MTTGGGEHAFAEDQPGHWLAIRVEPGSHRDEVIAALFAVGVQGIQEIDDQLVTLLDDESRADEVTCAVLAASPDARIETEAAPRIDWSERWKTALHAHRIGSLTIAPPWLVEHTDPARTIIIDPGMAFGTGEHATTRGVIRLLTELVREGDRVADLGAGSAILSIAAVKLGASHAFAIEIDADAIGNADENVARNGVIDRVTVLEGDAATLLPLVAPVDLVLANIISSVLLELLPSIDSSLKADGHAILSGILREERPQMISALAAQGWRVEREESEDVWWSVAIARH